MYRLGVDIGGTFTDFVLYDEVSSKVSVFKCLTTPADPSIGVIEGLGRLLEENSISFNQIREIVHATTLATNLVLERKGDRVGLITTKGFRDILYIQRQKRYNLYDLYIDKPTPLIPRRLIKEVTERVLYDGSIYIELSDDEVKMVTRELVEEDVNSIAVCLIHSYVNDKHERRIREIIEKEYPEVLVSISSEISPRIREYERTSTVVVNAYIRKKVSSYLNHLRRELDKRGCQANLLIMQSSGGIATTNLAEEQPCRIIESGPTAGVLVSVYYGRQQGAENIISFDMGGTTAKICVIKNDKPAIAEQFEAGRIKPLQEGSGLPITIPVIDLIEIGAGGGSIASIKRGLIQVGPESAGANPGPICYDLGGWEPTVTDADLILGYLNPGYFLGGEMRLNREASIKGIAEKIAKNIGFDVARASWGIHEIVNANMARATRLVTIERGHDPREFILAAFGGAGPIHGCRVAREIGAKRVIIPFGAGVMSALGLLVSDIKFDFSQTFIISLKKDALGKINFLLKEMEHRAKISLEKSNIKIGYTIVRTSDMRYIGQGFEINVPIPDGELTERSLTEIFESFNKIYADHYGYADPGEPIECVSWKLTASSPQPEVILEKFQKPMNKIHDALKERRRVFFPEFMGYVETDVYDWYRLYPGAVIEGQAIVEAKESTAVLLPQSKTFVDDYKNLAIHL
jgi:N-methylhydantoinase A